MSGVEDRSQGPIAIGPVQIAVHQHIGAARFSAVGVEEAEHLLVIQDARSCHDLPLQPPCCPLISRPVEIKIIQLHLLQRDLTQVLSALPQRRKAPSKGGRGCDL